MKVVRYFAFHQVILTYFILISAAAKSLHLVSFVTNGVESVEKGYFFIVCFYLVQCWFYDYTIIIYRAFINFKLCWSIDLETCL